MGEEAIRAINVDRALVGTRRERWAKPARWHDREAPTWLGVLLQCEAQDHPDGEHYSHTGPADKGPLGLTVQAPLPAGHDDLSRE